MAVVCASAHAGAAGLKAGSHYVNLGSSFAAGSGIGPASPGGAARCGQSARNYASLLADQLHLSLDDVSCGGARTEHILKPWNEIPPQINAVSDITRLVTVTVGGNDVSYVTNLFANSCPRDGEFTLNGRVMPCFQKKAIAEEDFTQLEASLRQIAREISARAPQAQVIFVQYVTLVPDRLCAAVPLSQDEADRIRLIGERLAKVTATVAEESGAMVLPADQLSIGNTVCDAEPWSIGASLTPDNAEGMPWHPNARGHEVIADQLREMLDHPASR